MSRGIKPVGLAMCSKTKLTHPAPARELYQGKLFKISVKWFSTRVDGWAILSAKHGVVLPDDIVYPYDKTLIGAPKHEVESWNWITNMKLRKLFPDREFLVICQREYLGALQGLDYKEAFPGNVLDDKIKMIEEALV